jgi:hypothetical protein
MPAIATTHSKSRPERSFAFAEHNIPLFTRSGSGIQAEVAK